MKKILYKLIIGCIIFCGISFGMSAQEVQASDIKYNKEITGKVKDDITKEYSFEVKSKQQVELVLKSTGDYHELGVCIYKINGMKDYEVYKWLEKHEEYLWSDDDDEVELYERYESDKIDKLIIYKSNDFISKYDEIKFKKTLSSGKYYIEIQNEDEWGTAKYKFTLKKILSEAETIKLNVKSVTLRYNKTKQLKATDKKGTDINYKAITYSSSNKKVATVSKTGKITAKNAGTCKITAKLKNGKKAVCKVTVPKLNMTEQLQQKPVYASVDCVNESVIYNNCWVKITNNSGKKISYVELQIVQYNNKGDKLYRPYSYYYINETIAKKAKKSFSFYVNDDTKKARVCIMKVYYSNGTTWTNPLYQTWANKYL